MIVGDWVRTPDGWVGQVKEIFTRRRGPGGRVCWVENEHGERTAIEERKLVPAESPMRGRT